MTLAQKIAIRRSIAAKKAAEAVAVTNGPVTGNGELDAGRTSSQDRRGWQPN